MYFNKYQWKNTTLPNFVDMMQLAYEQAGGDKSLGEDFTITRWC
jgi:hypothetical protein